MPDDQQEPIIKDMVKRYVEGLCWVMKYYYDGKMSTLVYSLDLTVLHRDNSE